MVPRCLEKASYAAAKFIRRKCARIEAKVTEDKLSASIGFLRAVGEGDFKQAKHLQKVYPRLASLVPPSSFPRIPELSELKDHILDLAHTNIQERIEELKREKQHLPEFIYHQRKVNILSNLQKLLPCGTARIDALKDEMTQEITTDPVKIGQVLSKY